MDRYEEALERAKKGLPIDEVFPELKESNDERIVEAISYAIVQSTHEDNTLIKGVSQKEAIAWLEKQKEQKPIPSLDRGDEIILKAICEELKDAPGWVERIKGWYSLAKDAQHPAEWSEDDEQFLLVCKNALQKYQYSDKWDAAIIYSWLEKRLKSLRPQPHWKPSEEQMKALKRFIGPSPTGIILGDLYDKLEKLK